MTFLRLLTVFLLSLVVYAQDDKFCAANSTEGGADCLDSEKLCSFWSQRGECDKNPEYMMQHCPKSCNACKNTGYVDEPKQVPNDDDDFGVKQASDNAYGAQIEKALDDMKIYFRELRTNPQTDDKTMELLEHCKNQHENCAYWKILGECDNNPAYMKIQCAAVCQSCEMLSVENRCPLDPEAPVAWKPGQVNEFFKNITTNPDFAQFEPHILSRPEYAEGDNSENAEYILGPWVVMFDNFISEEEAKRLIELGRNEGYKRSSDVGQIKYDGTFDSYVNSGRTSMNAWCQHGCYNDTIAQAVIQRITELTNIPEENSEYLQLLRYEEGQFYQAHHDLIEHQVDRQPGVRIMTVYIYLNDVEEGGGTRFPRLGLTVTPKRGRVVLWPSVLDEDPDKKDPRTIHEAMKVIKGVKYGANAWIHQRDFKGPNRNGCQ